MSEKFSKVPEELWALVAPLLPPEPPKPYGGRPRIPDQTILAGVLYRLQTGCQWKALPPQFGSGATCHRRFSQWVASGLFEKIMGAVLKFYDQTLGIAWDWTSMDAAIVKAPKGGDHTGPNPTDRAKSGTKRHVLTDERGVPLSITVSGANVPDMRMALPTLDATAEYVPGPCSAASVYSRWSFACSPAMPSTPSATPPAPRSNCRRPCARSSAAPTTSPIRSGAPAISPVIRTVCVPSRSRARGLGIAVA